MKKFFNDVKKYREYLVYAARSQLKAEVANSYLNWVWWVLEPLCFMAVYVIIFGYLFGAKEEHFGIYVFIGITMWDFFNHMMKDSVQLVKHKKPIVSKIYVPKYILVIEKMYINGFKMMIGFCIVTIMMIFARIPVSYRLLWIIPILISYWLFSFGVGCIVLHFGVFVDDLANVINIALRVIFYMTGIFYNIERRAGNLLGRILNRFNPLALMISSARSAILYDTTPLWKYLFAWMAVGVILSIIGIRLIQKNENSYVKVI